MYLSHRLFVGFVALAGFAGHCASSSETFVGSSESVMVEQRKVTELRVTSDMRRFTLKAPEARLTSRSGTRSASSGYLPLGGEVTGLFGTIQLGSGEVWLPNLAWSGDEGAAIRFDPAKGFKSSASLTGASFSCSARRTVVRTDAQGNAVDFGAVSITIELYDGTSVQLHCGRRGLEVHFVEGP